MDTSECLYTLIRLRESWRDMPARYGKWFTVYRYWHRNRSELMRAGLFRPALGRAA